MKLMKLLKNIELDIENIPLTEEDLNHIVATIKSLPTLQNLYLIDCQLTASGMKILADVLKDHKSLSLICLEGNLLDDEAARYLADIIRHSPNVKELNICKNKITDIGFQYLIDALQENSTLLDFYYSNNLIKSKNTSDTLVRLMALGNVFERRGLQSNMMKCKLR